MKAILHNYQERAVEFIKTHKYSALLLDMGLGKSLITLTAIRDLIDNLDIHRVLIIAPKKVAETTWTTECEKWDHLNYLSVSKVIGTEAQRIAALKREADIYVIGRDTFVWLVKYYKTRLPFDMIVIDELTSFKSNTSLRFKAFKLIRSQADRIVGLTGTPAPNGYIDLWAQMFCLDGGARLGKFITHYRNNFFNQVMSRQGYMLKCDLKPGAKEKIDNLISDISIAMEAKDYLHLPPRRDITQYVELPTDIMKRYQQFEKDMVMQIGDEKNVTASSAAALMGKLLQFSNGAIYNDEDVIDGGRKVTEIHKEKINALMEIQEQAKSSILVFYQFLHDRDRILEALPKGVKARVYEGEQDLRDWNGGKIDVLLAHPASCAYGLNLQEGGHIIVWFGTGYNLETYQQACARLHRQGQKYPVMNYHLVCKKTVDERALKAIHSKANDQKGLIQAVKQLMAKYKQS